MPIQSKKDLEYYLEQDRIALKRPAGFVLKKDNIWKFEILLRKAECSEKQNITVIVCLEF